MGSSSPALLLIGKQWIFIISLGRYLHFASILSKLGKTATAAWAGLKIVNFLASEIFSVTKYSWIRIIRGHKCRCFNFGLWQSWMDEEMTTDVSDGPAFARFDGWHWKRLRLCLKRPSFYCLIHFYKRCVSSLAPMGRSPWVRSGWVSVLSVTTFFIQG